MSESEIEEVTPLVRSAQQTLDDVREGAKTLIGITDVGDIVTHLKDSLWPALEAVAEQALANAEDNDDLGNVVEELAEGEGEMLTPETAGVFANILLSSEELAAELLKRHPTDADVIKRVKAHRLLLTAGQSVLAEITVGDPDDDADAPEDK